MSYPFYLQRAALSSSESEPLLTTAAARGEYLSRYGEETVENDGTSMSGENRQTIMRGVGNSMVDMGVSHTELNADHPATVSGSKIQQYKAALAATLGALAAGAVLGWSSPVVFAIIQPRSIAYDFSVTQAQGDWISSLINLGAAAACYPIGLIMDKYGRKHTMLALVLPFTLGWALIIWATNVGMLMAGRFITGFAGGAFCVTAPAYTSEIAEDSIRGTLGSFFQLMITIGILFAYIVGNYTTVYNFNIFCALIPIVFGIVFIFMPESPTFLMSKGRCEEAKASLLWLRGHDYNVNRDLCNLAHKFTESHNNQSSLRTNISQRNAVTAIVICYFLMIFQQFSGINAVIFNASAIFANAGAEIPKEISTIIIGIIQVAATLVSSIIIDHVGRRVLLLFSACMMSLCLFVLGIYFYLKDTRGMDSVIVQDMSWLPLVSLSVFIVAFSLGFGPIPWLMASELCQHNIKAFVCSTAGTLNWLLSFTVTSTFGPMKASIGMGQVFWMFSGIMGIGFLFVLLLVPETKGRSIEEIQHLLGGAHTPLQRHERHQRLLSD